MGRHGAENRNKALREAIHAAQVVLLIASPEARSSRHVRNALQVAKMYRRPVCAVWIAGEQWQQCIPEKGEGLQAIIDARQTDNPAILDEIIARLEENWIDADAGQESAQSVLLPVEPQPLVEPRNPYKGLRAFSSEDQGDFFGRDELVKDLIGALERSLSPQQASEESARLLAVLGPSGSGKSSVVMAGLLPLLQAGALPGSEEWVYLAPLTPGPHPIESLVNVLAPYFPQKSHKVLREDLEDDSTRGLHQLARELIGSRRTKTVLFVDQFEELFTQTSSIEEQQQFIDLLVTAATEPDGPVMLLLTLRADFYDRILSTSSLGMLIQHCQYAVLPMSMSEMRAAIEHPAALPDVQLTFEGDLVGDVLFELYGQVGALPLLQFTLDQLYQRREGALLTQQAYQEIGGVKGALAKHAEATYAALPSEEHRHLARLLFLRLVEPGTSEQDTTRRRVALSEFVLPSAAETVLLEEVVRVFIAARLLTGNMTADTPTLEVSHEALIREWVRLANWIHEARDDIFLQQAISSDVAEWIQRGKPRDRIYRGTQLAEAQAWARRNPPNIQETAFLQASATWQMQSLVGRVIIALLLLAATFAGALYGLTRPPDPTQVTTLQDNVNGSLRYCINNAPSGSTITFADDLRGTIKLTGGDLLVQAGRHLTLRGNPGANHIAISGGTDARIRVTQGSALNISDVDFKDTDVGVIGFFDNEGMMTLTNSSVSGIKNDYGVDGGVIESSGTLVISHSIFAHNAAIGNISYSSGGVINNDGTLTVIDSTFQNNLSQGQGSFGLGGAIKNFGGTIKIINSTFSGNTVSSDTDSAYGGAIDNETGPITIINSTFLNNRAVSSSGTSFGGGINNNQTGIVTITNSTFSGNVSSNSGTASTDNAQGGGIDNEGKLIVTSTTFSNNSTVSRNGTTFGGGIVNYRTGIVTVTNSTFAGNKAISKQGAQGGGIDNDGQLTVVNSTFFHNASSGGKGFGGGGTSFTGFKGSFTHLLFCTISGNRSSAGGGVWFDPQSDPNSHMTIGSSIIVANTAPNGPDISGKLISDGYILLTNGAGVTGLDARTDRQVSIAALKLDALLRNNGGPIQTLQLQPGSVASDVIPRAKCIINITDAAGHPLTITTDQRGDPRPDASEDACDSGAYESAS